MKKMLVWNAGSGKAVANQMVRENFPQSQIVDMGREVNLAEQIAAKVRQGAEVVVAAGGDGTVNAVVNALMQLEQRPRLAILPLGTANDFAGTLCIPDSIPEALKLMDTDQCLPIDVVRIQAEHFERFYANIAAGGNSVRVSQEMTEEMKARWGAFCYLRGGVEVLMDLQSFQITAECDGERFDGIDSWAVLVANGRTNAGRIVVAPKASPVDGLLDVIIIRDGTVLDIVDIVSNALLGSYLDCEQVIYRQVKRLRLHSDPSMPFTMDGEVIDREPVQFDVEQAAIQTYVGTQFLLDHATHLKEPRVASFRSVGVQNA